MSSVPAYRGFFYHIIIIEKKRECKEHIRFGAFFESGHERISKAERLCSSYPYFTIDVSSIYGYTNNK